MKWVWKTLSYPHGAWCISLLGGKLHRDMGTTGTQIGELWSRALELIKSRLQDPIYFDPFFADSLVDRVEGKTIYVVANSSVAVATLSAAPFKDIADQAVQEVTQSDYTVCFIPRQLSANAGASPSKSLFFANAKLNSNFTFRNFVVGASNREAYQASVLAAKNPGAFSNPILIYGDSGLGKTHLLQAVGNSVRENSPNTRAIYISSHDFIEEYTRFVRSDKTESFVGWFRDNVDVLLVDDVQFLANKPNTEETFFTIFNDLIASSKQIVLTCDQHPYRLAGLSDRLKTRFVSGLPLTISAPEREVCEEILKLKIESNGLRLEDFDPSVITYFADKFGKNIRELEGAFARLLFYAVNLAPGKRIDLKTAVEAVNPLAEVEGDLAELTVEKVIAAVATTYGLTAAQLTGKIRTAQIALARHIAMYICRDLLDAPFAKIWAAFGGRDHTTVMNGVEKVEKSLSSDKELQRVVKRIESKLK